METIDDMIAIDTRDDYVSPDPADLVEQSQLNLAVDRLISSLSTKDRKEERVLRMRFGVGVHEALTLDEIGMRFGVTRERIRQIESKAIRTLRHPSISKPFAHTVLGVQTEQNALSRMLAQAIELGIPVEDECAAASSRVWVRLLSTPDKKHQWLARKLIELGFRYSPGKGYWR